MLECPHMLKGLVDVVTSKGLQTSVVVETDAVLSGHSYVSPCQLTQG